MYIKGLMQGVRIYGRTIPSKHICLNLDAVFDRSLGLNRLHESLFRVEGIHLKKVSYAISLPF